MNERAPQSPQFEQEPIAQAQKLESRSHEFEEPVRLVKEFAELLVEEVAVESLKNDPNPDSIRTYARVKEEVTRMKFTIESKIPNDKRGLFIIQLKASGEGELAEIFEKEFPVN